MSLCVDESLADEHFGDAVADSLHNRLNDLRAADSVEELVAGSPQTGVRDGVECVRIQLGPTTWMTIIPNHNRPRLTTAGAADWRRIWRVRIVAIGD
jgi:hypothetical protein